MRTALALAFYALVMCCAIFVSIETVSVQMGLHNMDVNNGR